MLKEQWFEVEVTKNEGRLVHIVRHGMLKGINRQLNVNCLLGSTDRPSPS